MKNHFPISYSGNKRQEVERIYENLNFDGINTIVEPYCGTAALSFYISTHFPKRFTYILNDNCPFLIELYEIMQDPERTTKFEDEINAILLDSIDKIKYHALPKKTLIRWYIHNKVYNFRVGIFPLVYTYKPISLDCPIMHFLRNETVEIVLGEAMSLFETHAQRPTSLLFLDPPYLSACNEMYNTPTGNIYKYLYNNDICKMAAHICLCLEANWIIRLLFQKYKFIEYAKEYMINHKKTTHAIIINSVPILDPLAALSAQIGELKIEDQQQITELLERLKRK